MSSIFSKKKIKSGQPTFDIQNEFLLKFSFEISQKEKQFAAAKIKVCRSKFCTCIDQKDKWKFSQLFQQIYIILSNIFTHFKQRRLFNCQKKFISKKKKFSITKNSGLFIPKKNSTDSYIKRRLSTSLTRHTVRHLNQFYCFQGKFRVWLIFFYCIICSTIIIIILIMIAIINWSCTAIKKIRISAMNFFFFEHKTQTQK